MCAKRGRIVAARVHSARKGGCLPPRGCRPILHNSAAMSTRVFRFLLGVLLAAMLACAMQAATAAPLVIDRVQAVASPGERFPEGLPATSVQLPDDWSHSRPRHDGSVWYRAAS